MSVTSSPRTIEGVVDQYHREVAELDIPSFSTPSSSYKIPATSPYVNQFKLNRVINDIPILKLQLNQLKSNQKVKDVESKLFALQNLIDEKSYINDKLIQGWISSHTKIQDAEEESGERAKSIDSRIEVVENEDNLDSLRRRLLSGGTHTSLDGTTTNKSDIDRTNNYHESIQEDILSELSGFAASLKQSAVTLSSKLLDDQTILNKSGDNLMKNETLMKTVGHNLNSYVINKSGGKISFWFLMKVLLGSMLLFFMMVVLIKIFPKM